LGVKTTLRRQNRRPELPRYAYLYGPALQKIGDLASAQAVLEAAHLRHPNDREILWALATQSRDQGSSKTTIGPIVVAARLCRTFRRCIDSE
jgi:predicted Zn-dependent protease